MVGFLLDIFDKDCRRAACALRRERANLLYKSKGTCKGYILMVSSGKLTPFEYFKVVEAHNNTADIYNGNRYWWNNRITHI